MGQKLPNKSHSSFSNLFFFKKKKLAHIVATRWSPNPDFSRSDSNSWSADYCCRRGSVCVSTFRDMIIWDSNDTAYFVVRAKQLFVWCRQGGFFFFLLGHHTVNQASRDDRLQTDEAEHAISQDE